MLCEMCGKEETTDVMICNDCLNEITIGLVCCSAMLKTFWETIAKTNWTSTNE